MLLQRRHPPNAFIGVPVPDSSGFPPFESLRAVSPVDRIEAFADDRLYEVWEELLRGKPRGIKPSEIKPIEIKKLTTESRVHKMKPSEMIMQCASGFIAMGKSIEEKQNFLNAACTA